MLKGVSLYLVGMMGSGKSTVGRLVAARLGYRFLDLDELIEKISGLSIPQIFAERGEVVFRELETQVLMQVAPYTRVVVSTGGGVVLTPRNWGHLRHGVVVWLDAPVETLTRRALQNPGTRPLLTGADPQAKLAQLLEERKPLYTQADIRVEAQGPPAAVAEAVLTRLAERLAEDQEDMKLNNCPPFAQAEETN